MEFALAGDPEGVFIAHITEDIKLAAGSDRPRLYGRRPEVFLSGYVGAGNVGAEMRVNELVRQIEHVIPGGCRYSTLSKEREPIPGVLGTVSLLPPGGYIPNLLPAYVSSADIVVACEGSTFKSNFSDSLSAVMGGALALGRVTGRCSLAYGAEIGTISTRLEAFIREHLGDALVMCRTARSQEIGERIGCRTSLGTDTGWTFEPKWTDAEMRDATGQAPYLLVCPTNPYWWPVRPDPRRAFRQDRSGIDDPLRYGSVYFHQQTREGEERYEAYLRSLAEAASAIADARGLQILILGMEALDAAACADLARLLPGAKVRIGADHSVDFAVNLIRSAAFLISSRYHALLIALPAMVPAIGVATDERIGNLYETPHPAVVSASSVNLRQDLIARAESLNLSDVEFCAAATISVALPRLADMARCFCEELSSIYPSVNIRQDLAHWTDWLPRLPASVAQFV